MREVKWPLGATPYSSTNPDKYTNLSPACLQNVILASVGSELREEKRLEEKPLKSARNDGEVDFNRQQYGRWRKSKAGDTGSCLEITIRDARI